MSNDPIAQSLNLIPLEESRAQLVPSLTVENDFEYARGNIVAVIEKGQEALTGILDVASMSQHPRAYEVVATLVKAVSEANKDLLELQKRRRDLTEADPQSPRTINNNLFVGSTAELQKLLKKQNE